MHAFRQQGYAATSVRDLEAATGLTSGSLYNSYGDKQGLFAAAGAHYLRKVVDRRLSTYCPEGSGLAGLRALFLSTLVEPGGGCLITNCAIEFGAADAPEVVTAGLSVLKAAFKERLGGGEEADARAEVLLTLYQGLLVLVRAGYDARALERMISEFFETLSTSAKTE